MAMVAQLSLARPPVDINGTCVYVVLFSTESISLWSLSSFAENVVGRGRLKVIDLLGFLSKVVIVGDSRSKDTDLRGLFDPEDVAIEEDSGLAVPEEDGTASSA